MLSMVKPLLASQMDYVHLPSLSAQYLEKLCPLLEQLTDFLIFFTPDT